MAVDSGKFDEAAYGTERVLRGRGGETHQQAGDSRPALTTQQGTVVADDQNSLRSPVVGWPGHHRMPDRRARAALPAKVKKGQVLKLASALREGTPNRRRIALQMTKDMLDESSFEASPAHPVPGPIGKAGAKIADKRRHHTGD